MDDDLDLLAGSDGPRDSGRPPWTLLAGIAVVALLTLAGVGWLVSSVVGGDTAVTVGATATPSPTLAAPTTTPAVAPSPTDTGFPTALPTTTAAPAPTYSLPRVPVPSAATVVPRTTVPRPRPLPLPLPRPSTPAGSVEVPDVVGSKVRSATASLQAAGFRVSVLGGVLAPDRDKRRVTIQRPSGGSLARRGSTVILLTDGL